MSDGMSHGYRAHRTAVERVQETYGHLSLSDADALRRHHYDQAQALRRQIRALELQLERHDSAYDDLDLLLWESR